MKDKSKNRFHRSDLAVFFSFFRPHLGLFALDMSCAVAVAVIDLAFPYITRVSMQTLLPEKLYTTFFVIMAAMFAAYILKGLMYYLITVLGHRTGVYIEADMRHAVFNHMQRLSFSFFDRNRTGALMSRITSDLFEITELAHHGPEDILISVLTIIGWHRVAPGAGAGRLPAAAHPLHALAPREHEAREHRGKAPDGGN